MSGDYSRFNFDEARRYSALLMQQGRVLLDADWNELTDIIKRRIEKLSLDALGNPGVPQLTTPDAFLVSLLAGAPPDLALEPGRIYVDGLLAEIFPGETVTYLGQPFVPDPAPLPAGDVAVFLEVWDQELTWVEAPLLDVALGGVDTTTRLRTVWQLRVAEVDAAVCGLAVGDPPSAGRLTSRAIAPPAPDDPCILPPTPGYRGLENRFYRVEVHDGGALGTARFKWSRDNGSIVSPVSAVAVGGGQTTLTVGRIGRDPVMRFVAGDWVTVADDHRELMDEPGEPAQVIGTDEAAGTITLDRMIPVGGGRPFGLNTTEHAERHTRVQKWNQTAATNPVDGDGLIATAAGPLPLEDGIEVTFSVDPAGGTLRRGDYWAFWARTADASIEELDAAPPRGIIRHYVQLAAISGLGGPAPAVNNCRPPPDEAEACCTVVVRPGESLQAAIDALPSQGGCVCIKAGTHPVPAPLVINRTNVHMHGESPGAILQGGAPLLEIQASAGAIRIDNLDFVARVPSGSDVPIIAMGGASDVAIEDCRITTLASPNGTAILIVRTDMARISRNAISNVGFGIVVNGLSSLPVIEGNTIVFGSDRDAAPLGTGIWIDSNATACEIATNVILGSHLGIIVNDAPLEAPRSTASSTVIADNAILTGFVAGDGGNRARGIDAAADFTTVKGNRIALLAPAGNAIRVTGSGSTVSENKVLAILEGAPGVGLQIGYEGEGSRPCNTVTASVNHIGGVLHGILVFNASSIAIAENAIAIAGPQAAFGIQCLDTRATRVTDNRISGGTLAIGSTRGIDTRISGNDIFRPAFGIAVIEETGPMISSNRVREAAGSGIIAVTTLGRTEFIENRVTNAGYATAFSIGLGALLVIGEWHVEANEVMDTGVAIAGASASQRAIGIYGDLILEARVESNLVTYSNALSRNTAREDRAMFARGLIEFSLNFAPARLTFGFPIQIVDNKFIGTGRSALVELAQIPVSDNLVLRFERVFFTGNYCSHVSAAVNRPSATVVLVGHAGVVSSNHVKATTPGFFSFNFNNMPGPFFGNVMSGGVIAYAPFAPAADGLHNMTL